MELDPRIILLTDIITCFDTDSEKARKTIGKKGYFSFRLGNFYDLSMCDYGTLDLIDTANRDDDHGSDDVFHQKENDCYYSFFIPECFVKPKEKKYRPYTLMEFTAKFTVGLPIKFRKKGEKKDEWFSVLTGYWNHQIEDKVITYILIGSVQYTLDELFNEYEWQEHYTEDFKPFGVEE